MLTLKFRFEDKKNNAYNPDGSDVGGKKGIDSGLLWIEMNQSNIILEVFSVVEVIDGPKQNRIIT